MWWIRTPASDSRAGARRRSWRGTGSPPPALSPPPRGGGAPARAAGEQAGEQERPECAPDYGRFTLIVVPLLLPSTSWFNVRSYVRPASVTLTTVMFTEVTLRLSDGNSTMHVPLPPRSPVVQVLEFVPGWLQCPTTVAPFSGS